MIEQLRQTCRELLEQGKVNLVIGYSQVREGRPAVPVFITKPEDAAKLVWNNQCFTNLAVYLTRKEIRAAGKVAVIVKGCDERAVVVLEKESQLDRANLVVIGLACDGVGLTAGPGGPLAGKCRACDVHLPRFADIVIGESEAKSANDPIPAGQRYAALDEFIKKTPQERWAFWMAEFARCVKCYACRQVCPLCYCERCIVDKNRPTSIDTSAHLKGNVAWQITRAFHQAARCVGCGECARVCPAGIDLSFLNMTLARAAEENFDYRPGMDRAAEPAVGAYSLQDKENFIK